MKTTVVNIHCDEYDVYIGRAGRGQSGYFGNPFPLMDKSARGSTLEKYRDYFYKRIGTDPEFREKVHSLKGKRLGCFCKPHPCHGDIITEYLESIS
jgi:hypothetical protein